MGLEKVRDDMWYDDERRSAGRGRGYGRGWGRGGRHDDRGRGPGGPGGPDRGRGPGGPPWWKLRELFDERPPRADRGAVRYLVLDALSDVPRHGYEIMAKIEEKSEGA